MLEHIHFAPGFESFDAVEECYGPIWDATTLSKIARCPRYHQVRVEEGLQPKGREGPTLVAGIALHLALEFYYSTPARDASVERMAVEIARDEWAHWGLDPTSFDKKYAHYNADFLGVVLREYFSYWGSQAIEVFSPITGLRVEDLNLERVLAGRFPLTRDGYVMLGESNLVMLFDVDGEELVLAGKPDLPVVKQDGRCYVMDHKTTGGYLSSYWAKTHEISNKDRGYMAMVGSLLQRDMHGSVINGLHMGDSAYFNPNSKATKFARFQFDFTADHVQEALRNQLAWRKTAAFYRELGYFPQGCGYGGCQMPDLCRRDPPTRAVVKMNDYEINTRKFWNL